MRCTRQKHKYGSALKHMTGTQVQNSTQFVGSKDKISSPISIINIDTIRESQIKKDKQNKRINPLTTFNVPHTKHQSKIFKFIEQSNSLREETKQWSVKFSERVKTQSQKLSNQYSGRTLDYLKIIKKIEGSKHEKLIQLNKNYRINKNQLQILKKRSEQNLLENIECLRKREQILGCQQDQPILFDVTVEKNHKSKTQCSYFQDTFSLQNTENSIRFKRQEAMLRLKQNVKNKLSRRHMYHALKQKNETFNRIKIKIKKVSNKQLVGQYSHSQNQSSSLQHSESNKFQSKNISVSNFKGYSLPMYQKVSELKIQSKTLSLMCDISKITSENKNSNLLKKSKLFKIEPKSLSLDKYEIANPQKQQEIQVKKEQICHKTRRRIENRGGYKQTKNLMNQTTANEGLNMFRLLTPWHNDYPQ